MGKGKKRKGGGIGPQESEWVMKFRTGNLRGYFTKRTRERTLDSGHVRGLEIRCTEFLQSLPDIFFVKHDPFCEHLLFLDIIIAKKQGFMRSRRGTVKKDPTSYPNAILAKILIGQYSSCDICASLEECSDVTTAILTARGRMELGTLRCWDIENGELSRSALTLCEINSETSDQREREFEPKIPFPLLQTTNIWNPEQTAGDKPEEGEDDVKSSCPLCPGGLWDHMDAYPYFDSCIRNHNRCTNQDYDTPFILGYEGIHTIRAFFFHAFPRGLEKAEIKWDVSIYLSLDSKWEQLFAAATAIESSLLNVECYMKLSINVKPRALHRLVKDHPKIDSKAAVGMAV
ncbi:hypothetical protein Tco_0766602 [Tanacetum coccineum]